jgi:hypothetical protein
LLKTSKETPQLLANFYNEIDILNTLDDVINPSLIEHGDYETDHYLIMEWVDGEIPSACTRNKRLCWPITVAAMGTTFAAWPPPFRIWLKQNMAYAYRLD